MPHRDCIYDFKYMTKYCSFVISNNIQWYPLEQTPFERSIEQTSLRPQNCPIERTRLVSWIKSTQIAKQF